MTNKKVSALTSSAIPLSGTEVLPIVQSGNTVQVSVSNFTAGRSVAVADITTDNTSGLGVTPNAWASAWKMLQFASGASIGGYGSTYTVLRQNVYADNSGDKYISNGSAADYYQNSGQHIWRTAASGTTGNPASLTQTMALDANGNLFPTGNLVQATAAKGLTTGGSFALGFGTNGSTSQMSLNSTGSLSVFKAATASAPTYAVGAMYFDTTLNKLRIGGAAGWETVTSV